jgi:apolipoprotein D and lipocalin family protein
MDEATYQTMVATAKSQGYDVSKLQKTVQNSR